MKTKLPLILVIVVVVILIVVAIILGDVKQQGREGEKEEVGTTEQGTSLKDAGIAEEIYGFTTEIKGIKDKTMTLEGQIPLADESAGLIKGTVKAVVTDNTKIVKLKFPKEIPTDPNQPVFPEETKMNFDELKVGDKIDIGAVTNISENIKNGTEFELSHIFIVE